MNNTETIPIYKCRSSLPFDMPWSHLITWAVATSILSPITIMSNSALIYGLYKTQQLTTITNKFILVMCISDLATGIIFLPLIVIRICFKDIIHNCTFQFYVHYIGLLFAYFSAFTLMCISIDRYIHVTKLNKYNQFMNEFRMKVVIVFSLVASASIACITIMFPRFPQQLAVNLLDLAAVSFMFLLYTLVFRKIAIHTEKFKRMLEEQGTIQSTGRETKRELSSMKTIRFVLGALLVLYVPENICSVIWSYYRWDENNKLTLALNVALHWSYVIFWSNASINAMIFGYGNSVVRRFLLSKFWHSNHQVVPESGVKSTKQQARVQNKATGGLQC